MLLIPHVGPSVASLSEKISGIRSVGRFCVSRNVCKNSDIIPYIVRVAVFVFPYRFADNDLFNLEDPLKVFFGYNTLFRVFELLEDRFVFLKNSVFGFLPIDFLITFIASLISAIGLPFD